MIIKINPLSANPTKWSNKLKQFVANYLSESDHFVELGLKGLKYNTFFLYKQSIFDPRPKNCLRFSTKPPQKII